MSNHWLGPRDSLVFAFVFFSFGNDFRAHRNRSSKPLHKRTCQNQRPCGHSNEWIEIEFSIDAYIISLRITMWTKSKRTFKRIENCHRRLCEFSTKISVLLGTICNDRIVCLWKSFDWNNLWLQTFISDCMSQTNRWQKMLMTGIKEICTLGKRPAKNRKKSFQLIFVSFAVVVAVGSIFFFLFTVVSHRIEATK